MRFRRTRPISRRASPQIAGTGAAAGGAAGRLRAGAGLSDQAGALHPAVRRGRRRRRDLAAGRGEARREARPAFRGREHAGRRRHFRGARGAGRRQRRLHRRADHQRQRDQRAAVQEPAVRSGEGFHAGLADRHVRLPVHRQRQFALQDAGRLAEGGARAAGQAQRRHHHRGLDAAPDRGAVQVDRPASSS